MRTQDRTVVRVQRNGRVTVPIGLRNKLGLNQGDAIVVEETPRGVLLVPAEAAKGSDGVNVPSYPIERAWLYEHLLDPVRDDSPGITSMRRIGEALRSRLRETEPLPVP